MKKITLILAILFSLCSFGQVGTVFTVGGLNYKITAAAAAEVTVNPTTITGAFSIPSAIIYNSITYQITSISDSAFSRCTSLTSMAIPNSVTNIGSSAFSGSGLTSVTVPNSVTNIGSSAFAGCRSLTSANLPNSITSINGFTFNNCSSLTSIVIPNSVTNILDFAFAVSGLTTVIIPNSVTSIGPSSFLGCRSLNSITIPNAITNISRGVFSGCVNLTSVTVNWLTPLSIKDLNVFDSSSLSTKILNVPTGTQAIYKAADVWKDFGTITEYSAPIVGQTFKFNDINYIITKATLPYEVAVGLNGNTIQNSGRNNNIKQTGISGSLVIPNAFNNGTNSYVVTSISANAFQNSTSLSSVSIPSSVTTIGDFAFSNCTGLTAVTLNGSTPIAINSSIFANVTLANITLNIPNGTTTLYDISNVWKDFGTISTLTTTNFTTNSKLLFYPNPATSQINFSQEISTLEVFDFTGKKMKSYHKPTNSLDVSNLERGVYILSGTTTDGKSINEKLVKK